MGVVDGPSEKNDEIASRPPPSNRTRIAIIGGGIAGLYCAWKYLNGGGDPNGITIFEGADRLGGRIWSEKYPPEAELSKSEFFAEFGPMRIEPDQQKLLKELLLDDLKLGAGRSSSEDKNLPFLVDFPGYASPIDEMVPRYELRGEEIDQKTPLDLMKLAFVRILGRIGAPKSHSKGEKNERELECFRRMLKRGTDAMLLSVASHQSDWRGALENWINDLEEANYQNIREFAEFDGVPLHRMGFWNLLSEVLSHNAVMKLRDLGTFYHLIPENPNAAEWLIFWLRGLKTSGNLQGIFGGMQTIVEKVTEKIRAKGVNPNTEHFLTRVEAAGDKVRLMFVDISGNPKGTWIADQVILALPKAPLEKIALMSEGCFPREIREELDAVFGFPMVKVFVVVKRRWWHEEHRANVYATRIPTRELHYWSSLVPESPRGMIMIYIDRPASAYWANYVQQTGRQDKPEWREVSEGDWKAPMDRPPEPEDDEFAREQKRRLLTRVLEYLKDIGVESLRKTDILYYGLRDWGREPYVGANHAWRPERKSWEVMKKLSAFGLIGSSSKNLHICGEAYSDYHGFIEGSLRSAAHVLHILDPDQHPKTPTPWLCACKECQADTSREVREES